MNPPGGSELILAVVVGRLECVCEGAWVVRRNKVGICWPSSQIR
jgi:hypothetical protein